MEKEIEDIINEDNREREGGKRLLPERERERACNSISFFSFSPLLLLRHLHSLIVVEVGVIVLLGKGVFLSENDKIEF